MTPQELQSKLADLTATQTLLRADVAALLGILEALGKTTTLDGLSVAAYFSRQRGVELEKFLIEIEDAQPELAAHLQKYLDDARGHDA